MVLRTTWRKAQSNSPVADALGSLRGGAQQEHGGRTGHPTADVELRSYGGSFSSQTQASCRLSATRLGILALNDIEEHSTVSPYRER